MEEKLIRFCTQCGGALEKQWIAADERYRLVCVGCREICYQNPRLLVTSLIVWRSRLLLVQRAYAPEAGLWAPPSGFVEQGETLEQAATREVREETGVVIDEASLDLHLVTSIPRISEVYIGFRGQIDEASIQPRGEALAAGFFDEHSVPWDHLAFRETEGYLRQFFSELATKTFGIHLLRIDTLGVCTRAYSIETISPCIRRT